LTLHTPLRVLELFCGIGGCAAALGERARVVAAVDQSRQALRVYTANFSHPVHPVTVESIPDQTWRAWRADLWWMSPPCRPFTTRGRQRDMDDPRAGGLVTVVERVGAIRPTYVALENVPGFAGSRAHALVRDVLGRAGYTIRETLLCPTELGVPSRRQRFYLVAGRGELCAWPERLGQSVRLSSILDDTPARDLWCDANLATRYAGALNVVDSGDTAAATACFTSAYGRSVVRSGSYLHTPTGLRRFSPREILRLLGFSDEYRLPEDLALRTAWHLAGNSVSIPAVRWVLSAVPRAI